MHRFHVRVEAADLAIIDRARGRRTRSEYVGSAAVDRATRDIINAPSMPTPKVERSCFTCRFCPKNPFSSTCDPHKCGDDDVDRYIDASGVGDSDDGMPTNRTVDCPGWAAKEQG